MFVRKIYLFENMLQAEFEPEYVQAGPHNPDHWKKVLTDAKQLLTRISTLQPLAQSMACPYHTFMIGLTLLQT